MIGRLQLWASLVAVFAVTLAASWFGGRKSVQTGIKVQRLEDDLATVTRAKEIEDDIEVLGADALRERARKWVRKAD